MIVSLTIKIKENRFFFFFEYLNLLTATRGWNREMIGQRVAIVGGKSLLEFYNSHNSYYTILSFLDASIFIKSYRRLHATRFYRVQSPFSKYSLSIWGSLSCFKLHFSKIFESRNNFATMFNHYYLVRLS